METLEEDAIEEHTQTLMIMFFRKIKCVRFASMISKTMQKTQVRILASGIYNSHIHEDGRNMFIGTRKRQTKK